MNIKNLLLILTLSLTLIGCATNQPAKLNGLTPQDWMTVATNSVNAYNECAAYVTRMQQQHATSVNGVRREYVAVLTGLMRVLGTNQVALSTNQLNMENTSLRVVNRTNGSGVVLQMTEFSPVDAGTNQP